MQVLKDKIVEFIKTHGHEPSWIITNTVGYEQICKMCAAYHFNINPMVTELLSLKIAKAVVFEVSEHEVPWYEII